MPKGKSGKAGFKGKSASPYNRVILAQVGPTHGGTIYDKAVMWRDRTDGEEGERHFFVESYSNLCSSAPEVTAGQSQTADHLQVSWGQDHSHMRLEFREFDLVPRRQGVPKTKYRYFAKLQQCKLTVPMAWGHAGGSTIKMHVPLQR